MKIAVVAERAPGETRVALVPDLVGRLTALGHQVVVAPGAGVRAGFADDAYRAAGAEVGTGTTDVVLAVRAPELADLEQLAPGAAVVSLFSASPAVSSVATARGVGLLALERVPRISRAQTMDALTSQAMVAGYRGVVVAAELLPRMFALTMTAAGTVPAAEVLVLGAGVAGLQAIATARRLGAHVSGYDVRASSAEEIASLGATAVDLSLPPLDGAAGYARELTPERSARQAELLTPYVAAADVVITTASVPGRRAPVLVTREMVSAMRTGSVVVDLSADSGGNVEGVVPGETVEVAGVQVWGGTNVAGQVPTIASQLYAENLVNFVTLLDADPDDEIVRAARLG